MREKPKQSNNLEKLFHQPERRLSSVNIENMGLPPVSTGQAPKQISARTFWHWMLKKSTYLFPRQQFSMTWHEHLTTSPKHNSGITAQTQHLHSSHWSWSYAMGPTTCQTSNLFPKSTGKHLHSLRCLFVLIAIPSVLPRRVTRSLELGIWMYLV